MQASSALGAASVVTAAGSQRRKPRSVPAAVSEPCQTAVLVPKVKRFAVVLIVGSGTLLESCLARRTCSIA